VVDDGGYEQVEVKSKDFMRPSFEKRDEGRESNAAEELSRK
jgi:hypothetical protein